jgi:hypothetical protein
VSLSGGGARTPPLASSRAAAPSVISWCSVHWVVHWAAAGVRPLRVAQQSQCGSPACPQLLHCALGRALGSISQLTNIAFAAIKFKEEHPPAIHWAVAGVLRRAQLSLHSLAVHGFSGTVPAVDCAASHARLVVVCAPAVVVCAPAVVVCAPAVGSSVGTARLRERSAGDSASLCFLGVGPVDMFYHSKSGPQ